MQVKLADFGFMSEYSSKTKSAPMGTQGYNSPQINMNLDQDTEKADMFSLGAVMVTVLMRNPLFVDTDESKD